MKSEPEPPRDCLSLLNPPSDAVEPAVFQVSSFRGVRGGMKLPSCHFEIEFRIILFITLFLLKWPYLDAVLFIFWFSFSQYVLLVVIWTFNCCFRIRI